MLSGDDYADKGEPGYPQKGGTSAPNVYDWGVRSAVDAFAARVDEQVHVANVFHGNEGLAKKERACYRYPAWFLFRTG